MNDDPFAVSEQRPLGEELRLAGRCAIVTGASRGIGQAIAVRLAGAGATTVITGRDQGALDSTAALITGQGGRCASILADAGDINDVRRVTEFAIAQFGRLDILVNNAAVYASSLVLEMTEATWDQTLDTNLRGPFFAAQAAARCFIDAGHPGRIINILSTDAFRVSTTLAAYASAKSALLTATKALAKELAEYQILVNAVVPGSTLTAERQTMLDSGDFSSRVAPGATQTRVALNSLADSLGRPDRFPLGRPGLPLDIANAVLFLCGDLSTYITGTFITVDGGQSL